MLQALAAAPPDDEVSTLEENAAAHEALEAYERGDASSAESRHRLNQPWSYAVTPPARRDRTDSSMQASSYDFGSASSL
jgi:hypothetical protein